MSQTSRELLRASNFAILLSLQISKHFTGLHTLKAQSPGKFLNRAITFAELLFIASSLLGCASSGVVKNATPILTSKPVSLDFVFVQTSSSLNNLDPEKAVLNQSIITGLKQKEIFGVVSGKWEDASAVRGAEFALRS